MPRAAPKGWRTYAEYRAEYDDKAKTFRDSPRHDFTSHSADAFRYLCMAWRDGAASAPAKPKNSLGSLSDYTLDELFEIAARERHGSIRI